MTNEVFTEQSVEAPQSGVPGYSLLIAADVTPESPTTKPLFAHGMKWAPEQIGGGGAAGLNCPGDVASDLGDSTSPKFQTADPFIVWAEDHATMLGWQSRDYVGRARRQLETTQSWSIAREFQLGTIRDANSLNSWCLKDAEQIHPGDVSVSGAPTFGILQAIATLEMAMADTYKGRRGMIHLPFEPFTFINNDHLLHMAGNRYLTPAGTVVAADAGYTNESDGYLYAYGTLPVNVLLGAVHLNPGSFDEAWQQAIDRTVNKVQIYAERPVIVQVDGGINTVGGGASPATADAMFKVQLGEPLWATHS